MAFMSLACIELIYKIICGLSKNFKTGFRFSETNWGSFALWLILWLQWLKLTCWGGGGGGEKEWVSPIQPGKTEEAMNHRQNNYVKSVGTSPLRSN